MSAAVELEKRYGCPECRAVFRTGFARCPLDGAALQLLTGDPLEGATFADRYVIERCVGEGGMGRVYRARHQRVSRRFAIKVLFGDHATDEKMRERFAREAEAASRLAHPNVISVVDFGESGGLLYLVMDFVEGRELTDIIDREGPLAPPRVRRLVRQLCQGLVHAHGEGLVHRDFKPDNVIVAGEGDDENARIVDFGIAVMQELDERLTTEGIVVGTPAYMSPEQSMGAELDERTDLFSLGVMMYEMLAGVLPFSGSPIDIARQNLAVEPPPIAERVPGLEVDAGLEAIARKLMAKRPEERYQSAAEVIEALEDVVDAVADTAAAVVVSSPGEHETDSAAPLAPPVARWRRLAPLLLLAALIPAGIAVWLATRGDAEQASAVPPPPDAAVEAAALPLESPPDAAAVAETGAIDAAAIGDIDDEPAKPAVVKRDPPPKPEPDRSAKRDPEPPPAKPDPAPAPITTKSLTQLYVEVGEALQRLAERKGAAGAAELRARYRKIAFQDALRTPSLRREVDRQLRSLRRQVDRALK